MHGGQNGRDYNFHYAGNITSTTDANGGKITYFYNSIGQVYQVTDQEGASEYFYYDEEGRPETHIDRNGNMETTHYNMDGNLLYRRAVDKKGRNPVTYRYIYYPDGKIKQTEGGGITYDYAYTPNDLLKSKSASGKPLLEYTYDRNGNLSCLTDSIGNSLHYTYDTVNRLEQVSEGQGNILASYSYHSFGGLCKLQYGNGIQTEYKYNDVGTLSSLVTVTKQGQVLLNFNYAYDENGNCIQKSGDLYQNAYAYDCMNRLIEAVQDGKSEKYTYDLAGNRLKKESEQKTERYQYNAKNQLTGIQSGEKTIQYRYDPQGNMLEELGCTWKKHYTYDAANRQKKIELTRMSDDKSEYFHQLNCYDGEGLRYETKENGKVIRFLFDKGELTEEIREDAHIRYARGYDLLSLTWNETEKNYFVPDEMGSTLFLLDKDHEIQKTYHYDAFGTILNESGDTLNRLTYTGQIYDGVMGQYYLRARFYNPSIGRFMQEDVYRGDGLNLYSYCANNPVMYFDPSGFVHLCVNGKTVSQLETYEEVQYYRRLSKTPQFNSPLGKWTGDRGESKFIPSDPKMKAFLKQYGLDGIIYKNGVPDFTPFAETQVTLFNMHGGEYGRDFNFPEADKLAGPGHTQADIEAAKGIQYTWHECNDMKTMQLIPYYINNYFGHMGGVGEINLLFELFNPKQTWWFKSWQKK